MAYRINILSALALLGSTWQYIGSTLAVLGSTMAVLGSTRQYTGSTWLSALQMTTMFSVCSVEIVKQRPLSVLHSSQSTAHRITSHRETLITKREVSTWPTPMSAIRQYPEKHTSKSHTKSLFP